MKDLVSVLCKADDLVLDTSDGTFATAGAFLCLLRHRQIESFEKDFKWPQKRFRRLLKYIQSK